MKITCPSCAATYEVPEAVLAAKRAVRCARCGNNWVPGADWSPGDAAATQATEATLAPTPAEPAAATAPEAESTLPAATGSTQATLAAEPQPEIAPPHAPAAPPPPRPQLTAADEPALAPAKQIPVAGWAASIALLIILAAAAIVFRAQIMHAWPPSERLFAALGLYHSSQQ
jgi:predicted Zn finger-like uncharacterized protein